MLPGAFRGGRSLRLTALQGIYPGAHSLPVMSCVFAENDCRAMDLTRRSCRPVFTPIKLVTGATNPGRMS